MEFLVNHKWIHFAIHSAQIVNFWKQVQVQSSRSFQYLGQEHLQGHLEEGNMEKTESSITQYLIRKFAHS